MSTSSAHKADLWDKLVELLDERKILTFATDCDGGYKENEVKDERDLINLLENQGRWRNFYD